jgi:cytochrome c oxidase cbb3-type subunit 3
MFHAADLTRPDWQASVTDEQLATVIRGGKGKMPMFPDLPPRIVTGLVARIRALKGR